MPAPPLVRWIFWFNLAAEIGIIVTGGLVRLTGSGLGCPTWPQCVPGSFVPVRNQEQGIHKFIEFGNRTLTFVLVAAAVAVLWACYKHLAHRRGLKPLAWTLLGGIVAQAVIGGVSVRTGLSPATVSVHYAVSAILVAVSAMLVHRLGEGDSEPQWMVPPIVRGMAALACLMLGAVVILGTMVTGSGPHAGDADKPVRNGLDPRSISWLHADAVLLFIGLSLAVWLAVTLLDQHRLPSYDAGAHAVDTTGRTNAPGTSGRAWMWVLGVTVAQGVLGYVQFVLALPEGLVLVHMFLAALLVALTTRAYLSLRVR